jgi:plasmid replication initiation protein
MSQSRTIDQRPNETGFAKAGELIEIGGAGAGQLTAHDRVVLNLLYQHAGQRIADDVEHEIELKALRPAKSHNANERVRDSLHRLMTVVVDVAAGTEDRPKILKTHLFDFVELDVNEDDPRATVCYGVPKKLRAVLAKSGRWGRIKAEIVCAMTSKYAIALYELVQLRANLEKSVETFPIDRFRELMGVPTGKLTRGPDFMRRVIEPAALEVNGLSDIGVALEPQRKGSYGPITAITVAWWRKRGDEFRESVRERQRPKFGRLARLRGTVEEAKVPAQLGFEEIPAPAPPPARPRRTGKKPV